MLPPGAGREPQREIEESCKTREDLPQGHVSSRPLLGTVTVDSLVEVSVSWTRSSGNVASVSHHQCWGGLFRDAAALESPVLLCVSPYPISSKLI